MQLIHKSYKTLIAVVLSVFAVGLFFQSCEKKEDVFELTAFGPSDVVRGGEIFFVGTKLDEIVKIELPNGSTFGRDGENAFVSSSSERITIQIPVDYPLGLSGKVLYTLADGRSEYTVAHFRVLGEIRIDAIEPASNEENRLNPGQEITLTGINLKEVLAIQFKNGTRVEAVDFVSHTDDAIKLNLPLSVWSGEVKVEIFTGAYDEDGNEVKDLVKGPEIFVARPALSQINGQSGVVAVSPLSEITLSGENFGVIDLNNDNKVVVRFSNNATAYVFGEIDVNANTLKFTLPNSLMQGEEIAVKLTADDANEIESIVKFRIDRTFATGYKNSNLNLGLDVSMANRTFTLVGQNLKKELLKAPGTAVEFFDPETLTGAPFGVSNVENDENGNLIFRRIPDPVLNNRRELLRITLQTGEVLEYRLDFSKTEMDF